MSSRGTNSSRNAPPEFIVHACEVAAGENNDVPSPELLRLLRSGEAGADEFRQVYALVQRLCPQTATSLDKYLGPAAENVPWFLILCWTMVKSTAWCDTGTRYMITSAQSFSHLLKLAPIRPQLSPVSQNFGSQAGDVLAMRYRTVIQKMNKYRQLDLARVNLFRDIESLVRSILTTEEDAQTVTSTTRSIIADAVSTTSLKAHGMSRLLDNLWLSAELVDSSSKHGAPKRGSGRKAITGIETLRTEFDALKEHISHASTYTTSECSFLKWASVAIPVERSKQALPPSPKDKVSDLSQPLKPLPVPVPDYSSHTLKSEHHSTGSKTHDEVLDKVVFDAIPMMGSLEECILELIDTGSLSFSEICSISNGIDKNFSTLGLTVEDIDRYCSDLDDGLGGMSSNGDGDGVGHNEQDIFEYLVSAYVHSGADTQHNESLLHNHILQQLIVPVLSNETELSNLRQLHGNTMMRTANVCAKFCPYEIAWSKEALQQFS